MIGVPSDEHGEIPMAYVVLKAGVEKNAAKAEEIRKFLDGLVSPIKKLRGGVQFRDSIPRNPSGKILRREIRDELKAQMAAAQSKAKL